MYPRLLSYMFDVVYTFEPDPLNFFCLTNNCQRDNIIKMQAALGDVHKMITVYHRDKTNVGMHQVGETEGSVVPQLRIDDLDLHACGLIALDVEGYELNALMGAAETISKFRPVLALERPGPQVREFLADFGYQSIQTSSMDEIFKVPENYLLPD